MRKFLLIFALVFTTALYVRFVPAPQPTPVPQTPRIEYPVTTTRPTIRPRIKVYSPDLTIGAAEWYEKARQRFGDDVVLIAGHGENVLGVWALFPQNGPPVPLQWLVAIERQSNPRAVIVLLSCNPHHEKLDAPGVAYATENVWIHPDGSPFNDVQREVLDILFPQYVGSIDEFVFNPLPVLPPSPFPAEDK